MADRPTSSPPRVRVVEPGHAFVRRCLWEAALCGCVVVVVGSAACVAILESWSPLDAAYFAAVTVSTVGYGDLVPTHTISKTMACILSAAAITIFAAGLARAQQTAVQRWLAKKMLGDRGASTAAQQLQRSPANRLLLTGALLCALSGLAACALHLDDPSTFSFGDAVYFAVMTVTTIGFGDFVPKTPAGRLLTIVLALMGPLLMGRAVSSIVELYLDSIHVLDHARALRKEALDNLDASFTYNWWEDEDSPEHDHIGLVALTNSEESVAGVPAAANGGERRLGRGPRFAGTQTADGHRAIRNTLHNHARPSNVAGPMSPGLVENDGLLARERTGS